MGIVSAVVGALESVRQHDQNCRVLGTVTGFTCGTLVYFWLFVGLQAERNGPSGVAGVVATLLLAALTGVLGFVAAHLASRKVDTADAEK